MQIIQKEKIPKKVDKITLVVDGILNRREALDIFRQEYSAKAIRTRRRRLLLPDVTLELVRDDDYWAISLRCWWDGDRSRPMIEVMRKDGSRIMSLRKALLRSTRKARFARLYDDMAKRSKQTDDERARGEW